MIRCYLRFPYFNGHIVVEGGVSKDIPPVNYG